MAERGRPEVPRVVVECAGCGAKLQRRESDMARLRTGRVFCSKECRDAVGCKPRRGVKTACETCGVELYSTPSTPRRFCSKECHDTGQRVDKIMARCELCGTEFQRQRSQPRRYCGRSCYADARNSTDVGRLHNGKPVRKTQQGYLVVFEPTHPRSYRHGYVLEHRHVMEQKIGRLLEPGEVVHHINGKKWDNRPENLELMEHGAHSSLTGMELREARAEMAAELAEYRRRYGSLT